jgi:L-seryl-tRNA(Ser) seleniumtransferase
VPDVMRQSGATLVEVGTTNKTYVDDYKAAVNESTGLLMKVHPSNFRILGFTHEVSLDEIVALGDEMGLPVLEDLGSGVLVDLSIYGVEYEPTVQQSIEAGVDVVTFSGDKLLGGPQAGLIVGKTEYISAMKKHPLARALRIDKMTLAALEATLREYLDSEKVIESNPTLRMITISEDKLKNKANALAVSLVKVAGSVFDIYTEADVSRVGGGSLPLAELNTTVVAVRFAGSFSDLHTINEIEAALRGLKIPIIVRIKDNAVLLDVRTVQDGEEDIIVSSFKELAESLSVIV